MKKLLILAYDFPPYVSVGALRPYAWYKYLKEYGIYPIVVTRQWGNAYGDERDYIAPGESNETIIEETEYGTIIRTPYKPNMANRLMLRYGKRRFALLRKAISAYYEFVQYIWNIGPKSCVYRGAKQYLKTHKADAIIATGEPFVLFKYASVLSYKYNIPWIADYRDPWTQSNRANTYIKKKLYAYFEQKYTSNVSIITTVSTLLKNEISSLLNDKQYCIIPNGYDSENAECVRRIKPEKSKLRFAFAGTIYKYHPIESVMDAFNCFAQAYPNANIELNFYGMANHTGIDVFSKYPNIRSCINVYPKLSNDKLLQQLALCNVLLLLNDYAIVGTKIYDYLAVQRQILFCYSHDEEAEVLKKKYYGKYKDCSTPQQDIIDATNSGIIVKNKNELITMLSQIYQEFQISGRVACHTHDYQKYSRKFQVKKLANILTILLDENELKGANSLIII